MCLEAYQRLRLLIIVGGENEGLDRRMSFPAQLNASSYLPSAPGKKDTLFFYVRSWWPLWVLQSPKPLRWVLTPKKLRGGSRVRCKSHDTPGRHISQFWDWKSWTVCGQEGLTRERSKSLMEQPRGTPLAPRPEVLYPCYKACILPVRSVRNLWAMGQTWSTLLCCLQVG